jgi:hypothetical protein
MHACLLHIYNHAFTLFTFHCNLSLKISHDRVRATLFKQGPIFCHAYVMHSAISWFHVFKLSNDI